MTHGTVNNNSSLFTAVPLRQRRGAASTRNVDIQRQPGRYQERMKEAALLVTPLLDTSVFCYPRDLPSRSRVVSGEIGAS